MQNEYLQSSVHYARIKYTFILANMVNKSCKLQIYINLLQSLSKWFRIKISFTVLS